MLIIPCCLEPPCIGNVTTAHDTGTGHGKTHAVLSLLIKKRKEKGFARRFTQKSGNQNQVLQKSHKFVRR